MQKLLYTLTVIFCIFFFSIKGVFGDDCTQSCKISDTTAPVLEDYITAQRDVIANIGEAVRSQPTPSAGFFKSLAEGLTGGDNDKSRYLIKLNLRTHNALLNWHDFAWRSLDSSVNFLAYSIKGEIPTSIYRDLERLTAENKMLNNFLKNTIIAGYNKDSEITTACSGIDNCTLTGGYHDIITELIHNNNKLIEYYKLSILGQKDEFPTYNFLLVDNNFTTEFNSYYNKYTISDCRFCAGGFISKITENFKDFFLMTEASKKGFQEWEDAFDLLVGTKNAQYKISLKEKELLKNELSKEGINQSDATALLKNLDEYNNTNYNPGVPGSFVNSLYEMNDTIRSVATKIGHDGNALIESFTQISEQIAQNLSTESKDTIPLSSLIHTEENIESALVIMEEINTLYEKQIPFIARQNNTNDKIQDKIIKMHIDLSLAINILDKTIPISEKVCNDQDSGNGKCTY